MTVSDGKLRIVDGVDGEKSEHKEYIFKPKHLEADSIVMYGHSGNISLSAIKWLMKMKVPVTVLDWNGRMLTSMQPPESTNAKVRLAQYEAYSSDRRLEIAKLIIKAKFERTEAVLDWLEARYPCVKEYNQKGWFRRYYQELESADTTRRIIYVEGKVAVKFWKAIREIFGEKYDFEGRNFGHRQRAVGSADQVNTLFNYGYAILESHCWKACNITNLDPHLGFLHAHDEGKAPLVYDLQEPYRWLVDVAIIQALETGVFDRKDFVRTTELTLRLRPSGVQKLMYELEAQFSRQVRYRGKNEQWNRIMILKARELAGYLRGTRKGVDFGHPIAVIERQDDWEIRKKILSMSYSDWKALGFSKGTLYYLKRNASDTKPFTMNAGMRERLLDV